MNHQRTPAESDNPDHEATLRVRYPEADPQGVVHHAVYLHYFEHGRTELMRDLGIPYSELEKEGLQLMVTEASLRYLRSARYDDLLIVETRVERLSKTRIFIHYRVRREKNGDLTCEGRTTLAAMGRDGRPRPLPEKVRRLLQPGESE